MIALGRCGNCAIACAMITSGAPGGKAHAMPLGEQMRIAGLLLALIGRFLFRQKRDRLEFLTKVAYQATQKRLKGKTTQSFLRALIAGEDRRFFDHAGIDPIGITSAFWRFLRFGQLSGASTIEQQLVRILTGDKQRTFGRKIREMIMACLISKKYKKGEIAWMYMATAYYGWRMNGIEEACDRLGIKMPDVTPRQAASIIARLKYPEPCFPNDRRILQIERRTQHLLALMAVTDQNSKPEEVVPDAAVLDV